MSISTRATAQKQAQTTTMATSQPRRPSVEMKASDLKLLEVLERMEKNFKQELKNTRLEIRNDVKKEMEDLKSSIKSITEDITVMHSEIATLQQKSSEHEEQIKDMEVKQKYEMEQNLQKEIKLRRKCLKIRGLQENRAENLEELIISFLSEILEIPFEKLEWQVDKIFRIDSFIAKKRKLPRDIVVYFLKEKTRDKIMEKSYGKELRIGKSLIKLFKDIPPTILKKRKEYAFLTRFLNEKEIRYNWEAIEGLSFYWEGNKIRINSLEKAQNFISKAKEQEEGGPARSTEEPTQKYKDLNDKQRKKSLEKEVEEELQGAVGGSNQEEEDELEDT